MLKKLNKVEAGLGRGIQPPNVTSGVLNPANH